MFRLLILLLCAMIIVGCDDMQKPAMDIISETVATENAEPTIAEPDLTAEAPTTYSPYDVNQDGNVDNTDLTLVSAAIGETNPTNPRLDVDGNGSVDGADLILISQNFGDTLTEPETPAVQPEYLTLTLDNALALQPGIYRFRPNSFSGTDNDFGEEIIADLNWGSVSMFGDPRAGYPPDAPKIVVIIELDPQPFNEMLDGRKSIEFERLADGRVIVDELLVQIGEKLRQGTERGGTRGNWFEYTYIVYKGVALENLTNPDRVFEYE